MNLEPVIQLARVEHAAAIALMSRQYIENGLGWSWNVHRVEAAIRSDAMNVALMHERGDVIGFAIMQYGERTAHLALLAVHPDYRRRGLAGRLLSWLEKCADTAGIERVGVEARADNPVAIAFYQSRGYVQLAKVVGYYRGVLDAVRLEKNLWATTNC
jgi:[ribosomal protein S18]-alanine N-acetyltransferase